MGHVGESQWMPNIAAMTEHYKSFFTADGGQRIANYEAERAINYEISELL